MIVRALEILSSYVSAMFAKFSRFRHVSQMIGLVCINLVCFCEIYVTYLRPFLAICVSSLSEELNLRISDQSLLLMGLHPDAEKVTSDVDVEKGKKPKKVVKCDQFKSISLRVQINIKGPRHAKETWSRCHQYIRLQREPRTM